jgi:glycosyltransferase involved in cell wall biosynthesis
MKITISGYVGKKKTGVGRTLENILLNMPLAKEDEIHLYCNHDFQDFNFDKFRKQIIVHRYKISKNSSVLNLIWHQAVYPFKVLFTDADVSYIPNVTLLLLKFRPTVVVIHDLIEFNVPGKFSQLRMLYRKFALPITANRADKIITVSENSKRDITKYCKAKSSKVHVIYNGVSNEFTPLADGLVIRVKEKYKLPDKYVLFVGTIDHHGKNCMGLIEACVKLWQEQKIEHNVLLVGRKGFGFEKILDRINKLKVEKKVILLDFVDDQDLPCIYNGAGLLANLSLYEGFGLPVIEAMACGCPVIASNTSSLPEVAGNAAVLIDPNDIDAIANAIADVLSNPDKRKEMIQEGLKQSAKFSWRDSARKTLEIYESLKK